MDHIEVTTNASTGEVTTRVLSVEEVAELQKYADVYARLARDNILETVVDPLVSNPLRWADMTAEKQTEWAAYRRALLDVPQQEGFPTDIIWPTQPEE